LSSEHIVRGMLGIVSQAARSILVVEEDPTYSSSSGYSLEAAGYRVKLACADDATLR